MQSAVPQPFFPPSVNAPRIRCRIFWAGPAHGSRARLPASTRPSSQGPYRPPPCSELLARIIALSTLPTPSLIALCRPHYLEAAPGPCLPHFPACPPFCRQPRAGSCSHVLPAPAPQRALPVCLCGRSPPRQDALWPVGACRRQSCPRCATWARTPITPANHRHSTTTGRWCLPGPQLLASGIVGAGGSVVFAHFSGDQDSLAPTTPSARPRASVRGRRRDVTTARVSRVYLKGASLPHLCLRRGRCAARVLLTDLIE